MPVRVETSWNKWGFLNRSNVSYTSLATWENRETNHESKGYNNEHLTANEIQVYDRPLELQTERESGIWYTP